MKSKRFLLAVLPLLLVAAAGGNHQAFGPMRFGMSVEAAINANAHIEQSYQSHKRDSLTAADVRAQFVSNGSMRVSKNAALEAALPIKFSYNRLTVVNEVRVSTKAKKVDEYPTSVKQGWEVLRDIADGKFTRKGGQRQFPGVETLTMDDPTISKGTWAETVTDTWEFEGIKITLSVCMLPPYVASGATPRDYALYYSILRAVPQQ